MSDLPRLPRHSRAARSHSRAARRYVLAPLAAAALAGIVALPAVLPGGSDELFVRMDDARKAATAAGKASAKRPAHADMTDAPSVPVPSPAAAGSSADPATAAGTGAPPATASQPSTSATLRAAAAVRSEPPTSSTPARLAPRSSSATSTTTSSPSPRKPSGETARTTGETPSTTRPGRAAQSSSAEKSAEAEVLDIVNAERAAAGCGPVAHDSGLARLAGDYSADMADRGFFSHTDPDGQDPWDRASEAGIDYLRAENIARGHPTPADVMSSWMDSAGHRANILNCEYSKLGVGVHFASGGPWWTQSFGV